jgi:hypothetical protein
MPMLAQQVLYKSEFLYIYRLTMIEYLVYDTLMSKLKATEFPQ